MTSSSQFQEKVTSELDSILNAHKKLVKKVRAHKDAICSLKISRDDKILAVGMITGKIRILTLDNLDIIAEFDYAHQDAVNTIQISANNRYVISGSRDRRIKVFDIKKKIEVKEWKEAHEGDITSVIISEDGNSLYSAGHDCCINIYDLKSYTSLSKIENVHSEEITALIATKDGEYLISGGQDQNIHLIDIERQEISQSFELVHDSGITCLALSKDNTYLVSGSSDKTINIYSMDRRELLARIELVHESTITSIDITSDNRFIISGGLDCSIAFSDIEKRELTHRYENVHEDSVTAICCSKSSLRFVSASNDKLIRLWDIDQTFIHMSFDTGHKGEITQILLNSPKNQIITCSADRSIKIFNLKDGALITSFNNIHRRGITTMALSHSGKVLFSGSVDKCINVFDLDKMYMSSSIEDAHQGVVYGIAVAKDDSFFVSVGADRFLKLYNSLVDRSVSHGFKEAHDKTINKVCISEDGVYIITAGYERHIKIWHREKRELHFEFKNVHLSELSALTITHDSRYILSASRGLNIYDMQTLKILYQTKEFHKGMVTSMSITKDNRYMISSSTDHTLRIFDIENKVTILELDEVSERFLSSIITPDDKITISAAEDGRVYMFRSPIATGELYVSDPSLTIKSEIVRYMILYRFFNEPEGGKISIIKKYPEMILFPYGYNWFHLICLYHQDQNLLNEVINSKVPFIRDSSGKTPLHHLIESNPRKPTLINTVLSRFGDILNIEEDNFDILHSFSSIFVDLIKMSVPGLKNFLEHFMVKPKIAETEEIPLYVNVKNNKLKQIITDPIPLLRQDIYNQVLESSDGDANIISILCIPTPLDYDPISDDMNRIVNALVSTDEVDLLATKVVANLIDYNWHHNKLIHISNAAILTIYMIAFSIYASMTTKGSHYEVGLLVIIGIYSIVEAIKVVAMGGFGGYLSDVWNFTDVGVVLIHVVTLALSIKLGRLSEEHTAIAWLISFCLFFGYAKWFSYFRIWEPTRRLTRQLLQIFFDLRSFFLVLIMIIFGFTLIFMQFDIEGKIIGGFGDYILITYRLTFSDFNVDDFVGGQLFFMVVLTILLSVILFNMLVAIMTDSFEKVQENAVVSEAKELLHLIIQAVAVKRLFARTCCRRRLEKRLAIPIEKRRQYLFVAEEAGVGDDSQKDSKEWEGRLQTIKKSIKANEDNMKMALRRFEVKLEKDFDDIKVDTGHLDTGIRKLDGRMSRIELFLLKNSDPSENPQNEMTYKSGPASTFGERKDTYSRMPTMQKGSPNISMSARLNSPQPNLAQLKVLQTETYELSSPTPLLDRKGSPPAQ